MLRKLNAKYGGGRCYWRTTSNVLLTLTDGLGPYRPSSHYYSGENLIVQKQNPLYISLPNIQAFEKLKLPRKFYKEAAWIRKKQTEVTMSKISHWCAWIITYFLLSLPTVVRETQPWNTTLIPKGITSSLKSEHSDSLTTTIRCTFTAKFWPVINTLQTPGELTNSYSHTKSILLIECHWDEVCTRAYWPVQPGFIPVSL